MTNSNSWTFPIAFTTSNYIVGPLYWIDQICGIDLVKNLTHCYWASIIHGNWPVGGMYAIGI